MCLKYLYWDAIIICNIFLQFWLSQNLSSFLYVTFALALLHRWYPRFYRAMKLILFSHSHMKQVFNMCVNTVNNPYVSSREEPLVTWFKVWCAGPVRRSGFISYIINKSIGQYMESLCKCTIELWEMPSGLILSERKIHIYTS